MSLQHTFDFTTSTYDSLEELDAHWSNCTKCKLRRRQKCVTHGVGNRVNPTVMVVGQYPTDRETDTGIPFEGKGGGLIKDFFAKAGLSKDEVYYTNVIKCPTFGTKAIPKESMQCCAPYLDDEIVLLKPKLIIAMGTQGMARLLQRVKPKPKTVAAARARDWNYEGIRVLIIGNPVAIVHAKDAIDRQAKVLIYEEDLARTKHAVARTKGEQVTEQPKVATDIFGLYDEVLKCYRCSIGTTCSSRVFGSGPLDARIMLVGEGPGRQEDEEGNPFIGPAGRKLDEAITAAREETGNEAIMRENIYFTNVVKCRPSNQAGGDRAPNTEERANCAGFLFRQIQLIKPKIILALGRISMETLWGIQVKRVGERQGTVAPFCGDKNISVVGAWHPSYILRRQNNIENFNELVSAIRNCFERIAKE